MMPSSVNAHSNSMAASEVLVASHPNCLERMVRRDTVRLGETKRSPDACIEAGLEGSVALKLGGELCWDGMLDGKSIFRISESIQLRREQRMAQTVEDC